jgi:hypothetical protein
MGPDIGAFLFWVIVGYFVIAPDRASLTVSRGLSGAVRGALSGGSSADSSSSSGRKGKKAKGKKAKAGSDDASSGPSRWDSTRAGWREGVAAARKAREEGRDTWSRTSRAAGRAYGGTRTFADRAKTAYATKKATKKWTRGGNDDSTTTEATAAAVSTDSSAAADSPSPAVAGDTTPHPTADAGDSSESPATPVFTITEISGAAAAAGGTTERKNDDMKEHELASVQAVLAEATSYLAVVRALRQENAQTMRWSKRMSDRWSAVPWSTQGLDKAIAQIAEAPAVDEHMENGLLAAIAACKEAQELGERAAAAGAKGDLQAFKVA